MNTHLRSQTFVRTLLVTAGLMGIGLALNAATNPEQRSIGLAIVGALMTVLASATLAYLHSFLSPVKAVRVDEESEAMGRLSVHVQQALYGESFAAGLDIPIGVVGGRMAEAPAETGRPKIGEVTKTYGTREFIDKLSADPACTVLTGLPGSGKTSVLLRLARHLLEVRQQSGVGPVPLPLSLKSWSFDEHPLGEWVKADIHRRFFIPQPITAHWLRSGGVVLLLDGLDEVRSDRRLDCVAKLNQWIESASGTRVVVSCRFDTYREYARQLPIDQVATLMPLRPAVVRNFLQELSAKSLGESAAYPGPTVNTLVDLLDAGRHRGLDLYRPVLLAALAESLGSASGLATNTADSGKDAGALAFKLGREFAGHGDYAAARKAFTAARDDTNSGWRAQSAVRLGLLLHQDGETGAARDMLLEAMSLKLSHSFEAGGFHFSSSFLDADERQVFDCMRDGISYDECQVSSSARLAPSASARALRNLRGKGLVSELLDATGLSRFTRVHPALSED